MINWKRVSEIFEDFGEDGFAEVTDLFVLEPEEALERLVQAETPERMRAEFHFLKGAALTLGFDDIAEICATGEQLAEADQDCRAEKSQVIEQLPRTCAAFLEQWRSRVAVGSAK